MADTIAMNAAVATALTERRTTSESITTPTVSETKLMAARITEDVGGGRSEARTLQEEYDSLHQRSHDVEWRAATAGPG